MRRLIGKWLCKHGHHKLIEWTDPGCKNVGECVRCRTVHVIRSGSFRYGEIRGDSPDLQR